MATSSRSLLRRTPRRIAQTVMAVVAILLCATAQACWQEAAERYNINPYVLRAIAKCESSLNPQAMNRSHVERTGTYDIGLMQINSSNLRGLKAHGIGETELMDACTNINVGAWILAQKVQRYGNSWEAVGAYNAACSQLKGDACSAARNKYARCVYRNLPPELKGEPAADPQAVSAASTDQSPRRSARKSRAKAATQADQVATLTSQIVAVRVSP